MATPKKLKKWSQHVTETSDAMDIESNTFNRSSAKAIAEAVEHDAERSTRRKESPFRSAMGMLTFYINRAGKNLSSKQRKILEDAKDVLRAEFGPDAGAKTSVRPSGVKRPAKKATGKKSASPRSTAKPSALKKKTSSKKKTSTKKPRSGKKTA